MRTQLTSRGLDHEAVQVIEFGATKCTLGSMETFATSPSWKAVAIVSTPRTKARPHCQLEVLAGWMIAEEAIWKATRGPPLGSSSSASGSVTIIAVYASPAMLRVPFSTEREGCIADVTGGSLAA